MHWAQCQEPVWTLHTPSIIFLSSLKTSNWNYWSRHAKESISFHTIGPDLPFAYLFDSAMAESPDGEGVLMFGGQMGDMPNKIMELRAGANSWEILTETLEKPKFQHIVIPIPWENHFVKLPWRLK